MAESMTAARTYPVGKHPDLPPPIGTVGVLGWLRQNLFSSIPNTILTLVALYLLYLIIPSVLGWFIFDAQLAGDDRTDCVTAGACWTIIRHRFTGLIYGFFPSESYWRVNLTGILLLVALGPVLFSNLPFRRYLVYFSAAYPIVAYFLLYGGIFGLQVVETVKWGGLMLTVLIGVTGIVASLPIGILLALGRRSKMPIIRSMCVGFIEIVRGVPLITVLFMAAVLFPLFLPEGLNFNKLLRALIGVALFASAYLAEAVRGGLQAIPKGQYEAAESMGLSYWKSMYLVILPQALKISIPAIVNTFIGLFKDSTLVLVIGLFDILGMAKATVADANWIGLSTEIYVFTGVVFFIFCFGMSRYSIWLENKLHTGHKR